MRCHPSAARGAQVKNKHHYYQQHKPMLGSLQLASRRLMRLLPANRL